MADPGSDASPNSRLASDPIRTLLAVLVAALTLGGWLFALRRAEVRAAIGTQSPIWWVEQLILVAQAIVCIAVVRGAAGARRPASILTAIALGLGVLAWVQGMRLAGRHPIPFTPLLNALLLWRLTRRGATEASVGLAA
jgi:hypothetical protein